MIFCGRGGRIWFLCVAWKAATRVEFWKAGLSWAMAALGRTKAAVMRWEAAGAWRRTEGRMRDAIAVVVSGSCREDKQTRTREMFVDDVSMAEDSCGAPGGQSGLLRLWPVALCFARSAHVIFLPLELQS